MVRQREHVEDESEQQQSGNQEETPPASSVHEPEYGVNTSLAGLRVEPSRVPRTISALVLGPNVTHAVAVCGISARHAA